MTISLRSVRNAAAGAVGAGALTGAMLFGGVPVAQAAPPPAAGTSIAMAGPHGGAPGVPLRGGHGWGGGGGRGGDWGHGGDWGRGGDWGHGGDWGRGGWGWGQPWWNW
jgi:hypothetical protein